MRPARPSPAVGLTYPLAEGLEVVDVTTTGPADSCVGVIRARFDRDDHMTGSSRGRPRSETARLAILEATRALLIDDGYEDMTVTGIAARAGVGKQTVYRWWKSKAEIVAEAALNGVIPMETNQPVATHSLTADIYTLVERFTTPANVKGGSALIRALASAAAANETSGAQLWEKFTEPARASITRRLVTAVATGDVREDVDLDAVADAIIGSLLLLVLSRQPVTSARFEDLAAIILYGISTGPRREPHTGPPEERSTESSDGS